MSTLKLIGTMSIALVLSILGVSAASAAETPWQWLPGSVGETFAGKTGQHELQQKGGAAITCTSSLILLTDAKTGTSSELTEGAAGLDAKGALLVTHLVGCKSLGTGTNSDGDEKEIWLMHYEVKSCMINKAEKRFGWLFKLLPVHLEIPLVKQLITIEGSFVSEIKSITKLQYSVVIKQAGGVQAIEKCEGGEKETIKTKVGTGENIQSGIAAENAEITFDMTKDTAGEEMMEK